MEPAVPAPRDEPPEPDGKHQPGPAASATPPPPPPTETETEKPAKPEVVTKPARTVREAPATGSAPAKAAAAKTSPAKTAPIKTTPAKSAPAKSAAAKAAQAKTAPAKVTPTKAVAAKIIPDKTAPAKAAIASTTPKVDQTVPENPALDAVHAPVEGYPVSTWDRVWAEPWKTPEVLAQAAVARYGDEAERYVRWARATYPAASDERIAQATARRFVVQARAGVLAGLLVNHLGEAAVLTWLQARMVLHIAAAYRHDPCDPQRAPELITVLGAARAPVIGGVRAAGLRLASRLVPAAGLLVGVLANEASTEAVARRAFNLYRSLSRQS
jgi:uncharacterized protein (DUF697 family)